VPSYEYWLLTHFKKCGKSFSSNEELLQELKTATTVEYKKNDENFFKNSFQDSYKTTYLKQAILNCKQQNQHNQQNQTPNNNPSSQIYQLVEYIIQTLSP